MIDNSDARVAGIRQLQKDIWSLPKPPEFVIGQCVKCDHRGTINAETQVCLWHPKSSDRTTQEMTSGTANPTGAPE